MTYSGPAKRLLNSHWPTDSKSGLTLIEIILGMMVLSIVVLSVIGAGLSQSILNEHSRNLSRAVHDANRILEQIRQQNGGGVCATPSAVIAGGWDAWLAGQVPGKSVPVPTVAEERVIVTCQDQDGGALAADYCGPNQVSNLEWVSAGGNTTLDPIRITVSICWRHRSRTIGECTWNGAQLVANDGDGDGVIESPAMLTTLVTCRG